jgi:hypothetical protein
MRSSLNEENISGRVRQDIIWSEQLKDDEIVGSCVVHGGNVGS